MKELLDTYIRSLVERESTKQEHYDGGPEHHQDLGTFLCWLLERQGYTLHMYAYKRKGVERVPSMGRRQWGVDILASKPDDDGVDRAYRFVLKRGNFGRAEYQPSERGTMIRDLWDAADRHPSKDSQHALDGGNWERVTVVAVHNGDVDTEDIGDQVTRQCEQIKRQCAVDVDWWDANDLLALALMPPEIPEQNALDKQADASLFPPSVRPFARLALDSLARSTGGLGEAFDLHAVDQLIEQVLPLGRDETGRGLGVKLSLGQPLINRHLYRKSSELALFAGMLAVECSRVASSNTLPILDTIPRILCRIIEHLRRLSSGDFSGKNKFRKHDFRELLENLIDLYIQAADSLREHLTPLLNVPYGLALSGDGEQISYPVRALRLSGYLALAGQACLDRNRHEDAQRFADALDKLCNSNAGGVCNPVIDDQIIELAAIWKLWLQTDGQDRVVKTTSHLLVRLVRRNQLGFRLPALYMRASVPIAQENLHTLVHAYMAPRTRVPGFIDTGSTIVPLALYLCSQIGTPISDSLLTCFAPTAQPGKGAGQDHPQMRAVYLQSWQPPNDAADEWYVREIRRGMCKVYELEGGVSGLVTAFEKFHEAELTQMPETPAMRWGVSVVDWMAWSVWRTPPPMSRFLPKPKPATAAKAGKRSRSRPPKP